MTSPSLEKKLLEILPYNNSIENRIAYAQLFRDKFKTVQSCIDIDREDGTKMSLSEVDTASGATRESIAFEKQIGTQSRYGIAFSNIGKRSKSLFRFSIKVTNRRYDTEVRLLPRMSDVVERKLTPNMAITYKIMECKEKTSLSALPTSSKMIKRGSYYVIASELADGDALDFFGLKHDAATYESAIVQMIFGLHAFHKYIKYIHNDARTPNYLWHRITPGGYWHYRLEETGFDIFVPNNGHLMVLWDPGLAKKMVKATKIPLICKDFDLLYTTINMASSNDTFAGKPTPYKLPKYLQTIMYDLGEGFYNPTKKCNPTEYLDYIKKKKFKHILHTLPEGAVVINDTPYLL